MIRWLAKITYRTDGGPVEVEHAMEEIAELHDLVEHGPHWDAIVRIEIERVGHSTSPTLTIEEAQKL